MAGAKLVLYLFLLFVGGALSQAGDDHETKSETPTLFSNTKTIVKTGFDYIRSTFIPTSEEMKDLTQDLKNSFNNWKEDLKTRSTSTKQFARNMNEKFRQSFSKAKENADQLFKTSAEFFKKNVVKSVKSKVGQVKNVGKSVFSSVKHWVSNKMKPHDKQDQATNSES